MKAQMNHGRWIVDCPADDCYAALRVPVEVCDCTDEQVCDHPQIPCSATVNVELPDAADEITRLLDLRLRRVNRNWIPGETLEDLKAENLRYGVKL